MTKSNAIQRKLRFTKKSTAEVKYFYKCPHCSSVSYQWAAPDRRTLVCGAWRCNKRFYTYDGFATENDWGKSQYGHRVDWRKLHDEHLRKADAHWKAWVARNAAT
jgi:hypothetical protein